MCCKVSNCLTHNSDDKLAAGPVPCLIVHFIPDNGAPFFKGRVGPLADQCHPAERNNGTHGNLYSKRRPEAKRTKC